MLCCALNGVMLPLHSSEIENDGMQGDTRTSPQAFSADSSTVKM